MASQLIKLPTVVNCNEVPTKAHFLGTQVAITLNQMGVMNSIMTGMWGEIFCVHLSSYREKIIILTPLFLNLTHTFITRELYDVPQNILILIHLILAKG